MLQVADVSFAYRAARDDAPAVIQSVSLDVRRGALLGVLGPNGAGKTTLLRLMAGTLTPVSGRILGDAINTCRNGQLALHGAPTPSHNPPVIAQQQLGGSLP